ncbi:MAG: sodium:calcium antiporter [Chloroflexota bacterium]
MNEALIWWLVVFGAMSALIVAAGVLLARSGDRISDKTGLGGLLIGMVLVAAATSLPEIAVAVSAVIEGSPDLAIGNLLGSNMANMALLAVVDLAYRGRVWHRVGPGHARTAAVAIGLTSIAVLAILKPFELAIGWVGIESVIIFIGFVSLIAWTRRSSTPSDPTAEMAGEMSHTDDADAEDETAKSPSMLRDIRPELMRFGFAALVILAAAPVLVIAANGIAEESGLGESFVGASFLAFSTSLPELSTALAAVRMGAFDLAVGSLLGSNAFNMAIILLVDVFYFDGPILAAVDPIQAFVGVSAVLLMSIVLAGIVHGARTRARKLEPSSLMTIIVYLFLMYLIWTAGS